MTDYSFFPTSGNFTACCPLAFSFALSAASPVVLSAFHFASTSPAAVRAFPHAAT